MFGTVRQRLGAAAAGAGVVALLGGKLYAGQKYLEWRQRRAKLKSGYGIGPKKFAALPRRRQAQVLGYQRKKTRDLERVYGVRSRRGQRRLSL